MLCYLCLTPSCASRGDIALTSIEAEYLDVKQIIEKHFWFQISNAPEAASVICTSCWDHLHTFHQFYLSVERAHNAQIKTAKSVLVKDNEQDDTKINLETSLPVKEEQESKAEPSPQVKRKRGRPPKREMDYLPIGGDNDESNALMEVVLEEISLNEIKVELPEADLTTANVLGDSIHSDNNNSDHSDPSTDDSDSDDNDDTDVDCKPIVEEVKPEPEKCTRKVRGKYKKREPKIKNPVSTEKCDKTRKLNEYIAANFKLHCNVCNEQDFEDFTKLMRHFRIQHSVKRGYAVCCSKKFLKRTDLVDHLNYHENPKIFKCHICDHILGTGKSLQAHLRTHDLKNKGRVYKCEICSKSYYSQAIYQQHQQTHVPKEERHIKCAQCDKRFSTSSAMKQHLERVHLNKYSQICETCGKSIIGREAFALHMDEHANGGRQMFPCDICGVLLTSKLGLVRHTKLMHTDECHRPVECPICMKISPNANANRTHIQYMHSGRSHQCPMCEKTFKRPVYLREHMTTHTGAVLYTCPHCPKTFNSSANMHSHRKRMHPKEFEEARQQRYQAPVVGTERCTIKELSERKTAAKLQSTHTNEIKNDFNVVAIIEKELAITSTEALI